MTRDDLIFGRKPVMEMLEKGMRPDKILLQSGIEAGFNARIRTLAKELDVQVQTVPWQKLKSLTKAPHQGVVAFKAWVVYQQVQDVVHHIFEHGIDPLIVMLDRITDVRNLGAIARSAEVFGVHGLVIPASGSAPVNGEAVKASAGALMHIPVCKAKSMVRTLEELHDLGLKSYAADVRAEETLPDVRIQGPTVIVLGSEETGITRELQSAVHHTFRIPQSGDTESLNVSVAAGITLYHVLLERT